MPRTAVPHAPPPDADDRPLVLAHRGEWESRALRTLLESAGFTVFYTNTGTDALRLARGLAPVAIILDAKLEAVSAIAATRALDHDPLFDHATPIIFYASYPVSDALREDAIAAGAWDFVTAPLNPDMFVRKLLTFTRAARARLPEPALQFVDPATGLYTEYGLQQVAERLAARARRTNDPFACVAIRVAPAGDETPDDTVAVARFDDVARAYREFSRAADLVARIGDDSFLVVAPGTDAGGVHGYVDRLSRAIGGDARERRFHVSAGYAAVADLGVSDFSVSELMRRALLALRRSHHEVLSFDALTVH